MICSEKSKKDFNLAMVLLHSFEYDEAEKALEAYEANLKEHPNRFNSVFGAGLASEKSGKREKAKLYYRQLLTFVNPANCNRPELTAINLFLKKK